MAFQYGRSLLIVGGDLEREGLVVLEHGTAVEPDYKRSLGRTMNSTVQYVVPFCTPGTSLGVACGWRPTRAVGKGFCIETARSHRVIIVPKANRVLGQCMSPFL
jgi:hypothetical protein